MEGLSLAKVRVTFTVRRETENRGTMTLEFFSQMGWHATETGARIVGYDVEVFARAELYGVAPAQLNLSIPNASKSRLEVTWTESGESGKVSTWTCEFGAFDVPPAGFTSAIIDCAQALLRATYRREVGDIQTKTPWVLPELTALAEKQ